MTPLFILALVTPPAFGAFPNGYASCKVVTTQHTMVSGASDLANYPLAVILTDADLRTTANGGLVNNTNGYDIGFYPDCSGSGTALKWEVESYSAATGAIVAYVLRPALSHTTDDTIGMYYGGSFSSFQSTASAVWNTGYMGVWHLSDPTNPTDSTGVNNGTNHGATATTGKVAGGAGFSGSTYLDINNTVLSGITQATFSAWAKTTSTSTARILTWGVWGGGASAEGILLRQDSPGHAAFYLGLGASPSFASVLSSGAINDGNFHYLVGVKTPTQIFIYLDGVASAPVSATYTASTANEVQISGYNNGAGETWPGTIDEVRISSVARSADWILTEYRNQNAPGTYISAGPRIAGGARVRHVVTGGD